MVHKLKIIAAIIVAIENELKANPTDLVMVAGNGISTMVLSIVANHYYIITVGWAISINIVLLMITGWYFVINKMINVSLLEYLKNFILNYKYILINVR